MKKYEVLSPIAFAGERREIGTVVEMKDEDAAAFGTDFVRPVDEQPVTDAEASQPKQEEAAPKTADDQTGTEGGNAAVAGEGSQQG